MDTRRNQLWMKASLIHTTPTGDGTALRHDSTLKVEDSVAIYAAALHDPLSPASMHKAHGALVSGALPSREMLGKCAASASPHMEALSSTSILSCSRASTMHVATPVASEARGHGGCSSHAARTSTISAERHAWSKLDASGPYVGHATLWAAKRAVCGEAFLPSGDAATRRRSRT